MAVVVGGIQIDPQGQTLVVNITIPSTGSSVEAYTATTDRTFWPRTSSGAQVSFPVTISSPTTFYVTAKTDYLVSATANGVEVAGGYGQTVTVNVDSNRVTVTPAVRSFPEDERAQSGIFVDVAGPVAGATVPFLYWDKTPNGGGSPNMSFGGNLANVQYVANTSGYSNQAFGYGWRSGVPQTGNLGQITTGYDNTAVGAGVLVSATTAHSVCGMGADCLSSLTTGSQNTAIGAQSAEALTTGAQNAAFGVAALNSAVTSPDNTALGFSAMSHYTGTAGNNTAVGADAMYGVAGQSTGDYNTAVGSNALQAFTTGNQNTAVGYQAAYSTTAGAFHAVLGYQALYAGTTGTGSTVVGFQAGYNPGGGTNTGNATTTGAGQTLIGAETGQTSSTQVSYIACFGYRATAGAAGAVAIGTDHTGAGATTGTQDEIKLGTANHTVNIPTTSVLGNGTSTNLTALAKGTGAGPASDVVAGWIPMRNGANSGWIPWFQ